ncbi:MAG TPA: bifunctional diaminohydroxyphosphoribosylaminopyrimidine deaminase/5-amino-6-(5-phosphoribosylamino)uracil reductase RibD [Dehalococcoidia bacterium]|nr:bifunctional diaminohydroxyphosphoribosylaminopyrimidine deaminase/5-amino-6-(5-phosphoribosylamino)uracil reductase RibD [Dehalococcoidia bacterium]
MTPHMARALRLAAHALGAVSPNPAVGAVVVRDGRIVGEGWTQPPPGPHAEVVALAAAGPQARGAELYVTLEPCSHQGRTPPCVEGIVAAGTARVHMAMIDPDPRVSGRGRAALEAAGIAISLGDGEAESRRLLEAYVKQRQTGLPFVIAKFAASLDGRIAAASGDSRWVSSEQSRAWAHRLRTKIDAIAVGSDTVIVDNPLLTARPGGRSAKRQPLRVVLDTRGRIPASANILNRDAQTLVVTGPGSPPDWRRQIEATGAELLELPLDGEHIDPRALLAELGSRGVLSLLLEGGGRLLGGFFDRGLVGKVHAIVSPMIIGAGNAATPVHGRGAGTMAEALLLGDVSLRRLGPDILVTGYPKTR